MMLGVQALRVQALRALRPFEVGCTVRVAHTTEELSAHVELDGCLDIRPGDRVQVHGLPITPSFGEIRTERRRATVRRASPLTRLWVRCMGDLGCLEHLELSFTDRRTL